jgi:hypothetical protein
LDVKTFALRPQRRGSQRKLFIVDVEVKANFLLAGFQVLNFLAGSTEVIVGSAEVIVGFFV